MGTRDQFWPLINGLLLIIVTFLGEPDTVFVYCEDRISDSAHFQGLKVLTLPKNCYAKSSSFRFYAGSMVYREDALLKLAPITVDKGLFHSLVLANTSDLTQLLRETAWDVHTPTSVPFVMSFWQRFGGYVGLASLGLVGIVILVLFVKWKRQPTSPPE